MQEDNIKFKTNLNTFLKGSPKSYDFTAKTVEQVYNAVRNYAFSRLDVAHLNGEDCCFPTKESGFLTALPVEFKHKNATTILDNFPSLRYTFSKKHRTFYTTITPIKIVKNGLSRVRDLTILPFLRSLLIPADEDHMKLHKTILDVLRDNRFNTVVYRVDVTEMDYKEYDFKQDFDGNTVIVIKPPSPKVLEEAKLIVKQERLKEKRRLKRKRYLQNKKCRLSSDSEEASNDIQEEESENEILSSEDSSAGSTTDEESDNSSYDKLPPYVKFTRQLNENTDRDAKHEIIALLKDFYEESEAYKTFLENNEYNSVRVIKGFHRDRNDLGKSEHITVRFMNEYAKSNTMHIYISENCRKVSSITTIQEII